MKIIRLISSLTKVNKKIYINISSLFSIYIIRFLINILTLPHLIKITVLMHGKDIISQIIINYLIWIIEWSFNQHSSKLISVNDKDLKIKTKFLMQL